MASRSLFGPAGFGIGTRSSGIGPTRRREPLFEVGVDGHKFDDNLDTLKNLRFDSGSRPPMAEPGKWAFGGNAPQRGGNTR